MIKTASNYLDSAFVIFKVYCIFKKWILFFLSFQFNTFSISTLYTVMSGYVRFKQSRSIRFTKQMRLLQLSSTNTRVYKCQVQCTSGRLCATFVKRPLFPLGQVPQLCLALLFSRSLPLLYPFSYEKPAIGNFLE